MNRCKRFMIQKALYPCLDKALTLKTAEELLDSVNFSKNFPWYSGERHGRDIRPVTAGC